MSEPDMTDDELAELAKQNRAFVVNGLCQVCGLTDKHEPKCYVELVGQLIDVNSGLLKLADDQNNLNEKLLNHLDRTKSEAIYARAELDNIKAIIRDHTCGVGNGCMCGFDRKEDDPHTDRCFIPSRQEAELKAVLDE